MRLVIIGSGNVATVLGRLAKNAGHTIVQVVGRNSVTAQQLADELGCNSTTDFNEIDKTGDIFVVAISDDSLAGINKKFNVGDKVVLHTAGSVTKDMLEGTSAHYGVMYPLQSLRKENKNDHIEIPMLIDGNNGQAIHIISEFAKTIGTQVLWIHDEYDYTTPLRDALVTKDRKLPHVRFKITRGLGHRNVYRDEEVKNEVFNFL